MKIFSSIKYARDRYSLRIINLLAIGFLTYVVLSSNLSRSLAEITLIAAKKRIRTAQGFYSTTRLSFTCTKIIRVIVNDRTVAALSALIAPQEAAGTQA